MIDISDLLIIYLTCGAPFGVYILLNDRAGYNRRWLKSFVAFVCWIPFAAKLLQEKIRSFKQLTNEFVKTQKVDADFDQKLYFYQKRFENILRERGASLSLYRFRELYERYSGLTRAVNVANDGFGQEPEVHEIFRVSSRPVSSVSSICLTRRNRLRLSFHQKKARRDFVAYVKELSELSRNRQKLVETACGFVKLINDPAALVNLNEYFAEIQQTALMPRVNTREREIWTIDQQESIKADSLRVQVRAATASTNLPTSD